MTSYSDQILTVELSGRIFRINKNQQLVIQKSNDGHLSESSHVDKVDVPKAVVKVLPDVRTTDFKMPEEYIQYNGREADTDEDRVEYDIDKEDVVWLKLANERRKLSQLKQIKDDVLELVIDRLEKESHFQISANSGADRNPYFSQVDNDAACCICNDTEDSNVNQIIFCDMCNIPVHQECYGVPYIPEGQWLCRRCQLSPSVSVSCALCPYAFGAFKQTSCGQWAHVICALWLNEVHFANVVFNEPIEGIKDALKRRAKLRCIICRQKIGACLQCSSRVCRTSFHVTCAVFAGFYMEVKSESSRSSGSVNRIAYCQKHYPESRKPKMSETAWKRFTNRKILQAKTQVLNTAREAPQISIPVIPENKVEKIRNELNLDSITDICYYWALKRRSRFGVPLIRRLQVYQSQKMLKRQQDKSAQNNSIAATSEYSNAEQTNDFARKRRRNVSSKTKGISATNSPYASQMHSPAVVGGASSPMVRSLGMGGGTIIGNVANGVELAPEQIYILRLRANLERIRLLCELVKKREKLKREFVATTGSMLERCAKAVTGATLDDFVLPKSDSNGKQTSIERNFMLEHLTNLALIKEADFEEVTTKLECNSPCADTSTIDKIPPPPPPITTATTTASSRRSSAKGVGVPKRTGKQAKTLAITAIDKNDAVDVIAGNNKKRKRRIEDFFGTVSSPVIISDASPSTSFGVPESPSISFPTSRMRSNNNISVGSRSSRRHYFDETQMEPFSSDTGDLTATSMDEDDDDELQDDTLTALSLNPASLMSTPQLNRRNNIDDRYSRTNINDQSLMSQQCSFTRRQKLAALDETSVLSNENILDNRSSKRKRRLPGRLQCNEFDSSDPNLFAHNDIVWASLGNSGEGVEMPARVIDLRMRALIDDGFPVDQALRAKPPPDEYGMQRHTLVVFFDSAKTWKWIASTQLTHCDLTEWPKNFSVNARTPYVAALKKARQFWKEMLRE